jgi:hypothetical protein
VDSRHLEPCPSVFQSVTFQRPLWSCLCAAAQLLGIQHLWEMGAPLSRVTLIASWNFRRFASTLETLSLLIFLHRLWVAASISVIVRK